MHKKEKIHACFTFLYLFILLYVSFFSISQFLFIIIYLLLSMLTVYNETKMATVCVLYAVIQFHNRFFVHRFDDSSIPLSIIFIYPTSFCFCTKLHNQYVVGLDQKIISVSTDKKIFLPLVLLHHNR